MAANNAYRRAVRLIVIRVAANVLTLGALVLAMYFSWRRPSEGLLVFCQWFFGVAAVVWVAASRLSRWVRRTCTDPDEGLVRLPGHRKATLVRWRVASPGAMPMRPGRGEQPAPGGAGGRRGCASCRAGGMTPPSP